MVKKMNEKKINILGTEYRLEYRKKEDDSNLNSNCDGYTDTSVKLLVVEDMQPEEGCKLDLTEYRKRVARHEIIHAFLFESGMEANTHVCGNGWAANEEMVDWIAIQFPKILEAFKVADVL